MQAHKDSLLKLLSEMRSHRELLLYPLSDNETQPNVQTIQATVELQFICLYHYFDKGFFFKYYHIVSNLKKKVNIISILTKYDKIKIHVRLNKLVIQHG